MRKAVLVLFALFIVFAAPASFAICLTCNFDTCNCDRGFPGAPRCASGFPCCETLGSCLVPPSPIAGAWTVASVEITRPSATPVRTTPQQKLARAATTAPVPHTR
jgi:hypothetical protein